MPFREELWNSELFATARELAGLGRGEGEGQTEFSSLLRPVWRGSQRGTRRQMCAYFLRDGKINLPVVADNGHPSSGTAVQPAEQLFTRRLEKRSVNAQRHQRLPQRHETPEASYVRGLSLYFQGQKPKLTRGLRLLLFFENTARCIGAKSDRAQTCPDLFRHMSCPSRLPGSADERPLSFLPSLHSSASVLC